MKNIQAPFNKIYKELEAFKALKPGYSLYNQIKWMGIYYDDPYTLKNPDEFRFSAGFIIPGDAPLA